MLSSPYFRGGGRGVILVALAIGIGACSNIRGQLGMGKNSPDEFRVVKSAPLVLPPDYTLRPPDPGAPRPQETSAQNKAKEALFGGASESVATQPYVTEQGAVVAHSVGEEALLTRAGTTSALPGIRRVINEDNALYAEDDKSFIDALIFWQDQSPTGDSIVDPAKESQRLQEASALGIPPNESETAVIKRRKKAIFEGIF